MLRRLSCLQEFVQHFRHFSRSETRPSKHRSAFWTISHWKVAGSCTHSHLWPCSSFIHAAWSVANDSPQTCCDLVSRKVKVETMVNLRWLRWINNPNPRSMSVPQNKQEQEAGESFNHVDGRALVYQSNADLKSYNLVSDWLTFFKFKFIIL